MDIFIKHPHSVCMNYITHLLFSLKLSCLFFKSSIEAFIHAIFPFFCITSSSKNTKHILKLLENSGCKKK